MILNDAQAQELRHTLYTKGWQEIMKPFLQMRGKAAMQALLQTPSERNGDFKGEPDDAMRYRIREIEFFLTIFQQAVETFETNRQRAEKQDAEGKEVPVGHPYATDGETGSEPA